MANKFYLFGIALLAAVCVAILVAYPHLPEMVPTHWNIHGEANGFSPKWLLFVIFPGLMAGIMILFRLLPWLSPKQWSVESFRQTYLYIMVVLSCLVAFLAAVTLWAGTGRAIDVTRVVIGAVCLLFALIGPALSRVHRNFYIGVRTPWTLANDRVWDDTHRLAMKTFVAAGLAGLALTVMGQSGWPTFVVLMMGALVPAVFSLVIYKRLERSGSL
jgi:uncharacterized membrane protein